MAQRDVVDGDRRPQVQHVGEREGRRPGVLGAVEPSPDRVDPLPQQAALATGPPGGPEDQPDDDHLAAPATFQDEVLDLARDLLLGPDDLVVEQPEHQADPLDRASVGEPGERAPAHDCPAPLRTMRGIAVTDATTTTTR